MHRTSGWIGWALCLCASLTVSAQDYPETDEMILDLIRGDGTRPETGAEPAADFLRCNKVMKRGWRKYSALISDSSRNSNTTEYKYSVFSALRVKKSTRSKNSDYCTLHSIIITCHFILNTLFTAVYLYMSIITIFVFDNIRYELWLRSN